MPCLVRSAPRFLCRRDFCRSRIVHPHRQQRAQVAPAVQRKRRQKIEPGKTHIHSHQFGQQVFTDEVGALNTSEFLFRPCANTDPLHGSTFTNGPADVHHQAVSEMASGSVDANFAHA